MASQDNLNQSLQDIKRRAFLGSFFNVVFLICALVTTVVYFNYNDQQLKQLQAMESQKVSILYLHTSIIEAESMLLEVLVFDKKKLIPQLLARSEDFYAAFSKYQDTAYLHGFGYDLSYAQESEPVIYRLREDIVRMLGLYRQQQRQQALDFYNNSMSYRLNILRNIVETSLFSTDAQIRQHNLNYRQFNEQIGWLLALIFILFAIGLIWINIRRSKWINIEIEQHNNLVNALTQAQDKEKQLIAQLQQSNDELMRYTYTVSHDLKSPLITIGGFIGLLESDIAKGSQDKINSDLFRIKEAATSMQLLLDGLLNLSRIGRVASPAVAVDLNSLITEVMQLISGISQERKIKFEIDVDFPMVSYDPLRLREVFQNLLENAIKYMGDQDKPLIKIEAKLISGAILCSVTDNGIGVAPQYLEKIFGLFDTLANQASGQGIGLALVKRIVEHHGGKIWCASDGLNQGCIFYFTIPK